MPWHTDRLARAVSLKELPGMHILCTYNFFSLNCWVYIQNLLSCNGFILFELNLNLNHDRLAYPLVASVPTVSGFLLLITYFESGGLCIKHLLDLTFNKLDMEIDLENFILN